MKTHDYSLSIPAIGTGMAEKDQGNFDAGFVNIPAYLFIKDLDVVFIKGKKGSGKSAIRLKYLESNDCDFSWVQSVKSSETGTKGYLSYGTSLQQVRKLFGNKLHKNDINIRAWKVFYYINIMINLIENKSNLDIGVDDEIEIIESYLVKGGWYDKGRYDKYLAITEVIDKLFNIISSALSLNESNISQTVLDRLVFGVKYDQTEDALRRVLDKIPGKYCVLVDGLDEALESNARLEPNELEDFFSSFLQCTYGLSYPLYHENLVIKAFVPKDFFEKIQFRQKGKAILCAEEIVWDGDKKVDVVLERLRVNLKKADAGSMVDEEILDYYFPLEMNFFSLDGFRGKPVTFKVWKFIKDFTITPRDYIHLCKRIFKAANDRRERNIEKETVLDVIKVYSKEKRDALVSELAYTYTQIEAVVNYFTDTHRYHSLEDLYHIFPDRGLLHDSEMVKEYLQCLYEYGFLGIVQGGTGSGVSGQGGTNQELYYEENSHLSIAKNGKICINKSFCPALNIRKYAEYEYW